MLTVTGTASLIRVLSIGPSVRSMRALLCFVVIFVFDLVNLSCSLKWEFQVRGSSTPWCDGMFLWNCYHIIWNWVSITTSWNTRSGPGVQRLQPMDTAHNINQNLENPSYPIEWNGFFYHIKIPLIRAVWGFFNPERWTLRAGSKPEGRSPKPLNLGISKWYISTKYFVSREYWNKCKNSKIRVALSLKLVYICDKFKETAYL